MAEEKPMSPQKDDLKSDGRSGVCVYTSVCEEDAHWLPQYMAEMARLEIPYVILMDRCSEATISLATKHPLCAGFYVRDPEEGEFSEQCKQKVFNRVVAGGYKWALAMDVDETFEKGAKEKIGRILDLEVAIATVGWVNLWMDCKHLRVDGPFQMGHRVKFYNLSTHRFAFLDGKVNGAYAIDDKGRRIKPEIPHVRSDLVCLHWGMMTPEMCQLHKDRWDRIYGTMGGNPYGFWNYACDPKVVPEVVEHDYL